MSAERWATLIQETRELRSQAAETRMLARAIRLQTGFDVAASLQLRHELVQIRMASSLMRQARTNQKQSLRPNTSEE